MGVYCSHGGDDMTDELETVEFAADYLKVSRETVRRLLRTGDIQAVKIGKTWRIRRSEIERIAEQGVHLVKVTQ